MVFDADDERARQASRDNVQRKRQATELLRGIRRELSPQVRADLRLAAQDLYDEAGLPR